MKYTQRLRALEQREIRRLAAEAGKPYGFTADEVLDEAMALLALPPDELQRELDALERLAHELNRPEGDADAPI